MGLDVLRIDIVCDVEGLRQIIVTRSTQRLWEFYYTVSISLDSTLSANFASLLPISPNQHLLVVHQARQARTLVFVFACGGWSSSTPPAHFIFGREKMGIAFWGLEICRAEVGTGRSLWGRALVSPVFRFPVVTI
jgi:hypothetical protein